MNNSRLKKAYKYYNRKFFGGELPSTSEVKLQWEDLGQYLMGYQDSIQGVISINRRYRDANPVWRLTLIHEMAHLATSKERAHHGKKFQATMLRLAKAGALNKLW